MEKKLNLENNHLEDADVVIEVFAYYTLANFISQRSRCWVAENVTKDSKWSIDKKLIIPTENMPHFMHGCFEDSLVIFEES